MNSNEQNNILFHPLKIGDILIPNRIVMAPLTRQRSNDLRIPNDLMAEYYSQRASAGLIISEATVVDAKGVGYKRTPGIWNKDQTEGWKKITDAVHRKNGKIFVQLWHVGRISDPELLDGDIPVAPSAVKPKGLVSLLRPERPYVTPRALETQEVKDLVNKFRLAAINAKEANFDGVEIHAANGYLIDQFLQSSTNLRSDEYGGSLQNRARFLLEIVDALIPIWGAGKVGVHLAPACDSHDMGDAHPEETFSYIAKELGKRKIAFIFTREIQDTKYLTKTIKKEFGGVVIANQGLTTEAAVNTIKTGLADAAAWGKYFISNPDLVEKIQNQIDFTPFKPEYFYTDGPQGYTDYPRYKD